MKNKKGQSEMIGFGLIIIIVAVLIVVFLSISINSDDSEFTETYEMESFLQSMLGVTTNCEERGSYLTLDKTIQRCIEEQMCQNDLDPCEIIEEEIPEIVNISWPIGENRLTKGYEFNITTPEEPEFYHFDKGNKTNSRKGTIQPYSDGIRIIFIAYG